MTTTQTETAPTPYLDETADIAARWDASRARSLQREVGVSELGGCRSAIGFRLAGAWESDTTDTWRAIVGTAMHDWLTERRRESDPDNEYDVHITYRGTGGHPDEVNRARNTCAEWKFPRLSTSHLWQRDDSAFLPKRMQAHTYAAGLIEAGVLREEGCRVVVAVMPVDGTYEDWWTHEESFSWALANLGPDRRAEVEQMQAEGTPLPRDKPWTWCEDYCEFFTLCRGGTTQPDNEPITDPELASAVRQYGETLEAIRPLEKIKKELAAEIRGQSGVVLDEQGVGWRVGMTKPSGTKFVTDYAELEKLAANAGLPVPEREVATSSPSLSVKPVKPAAKKAAKK